MRSVVAEDTGAEGIGSAVGKGDGLWDGRGATHDETNRCKELGLGDAHTR